MNTINSLKEEDDFKEKVCESYPEYFGNKNTKYYQFQKKEEKYFNRLHEEKKHSGTTRVDFNEPGVLSYQIIFASK